MSYNKRLLKQGTIKRAYAVDLKHDVLQLPQKELIIGTNMVTEKKISEVALELMNKHSVIETIHIKENIITDKQLDILCRGVAENHSIKCIELEGCRLRNNAIEKLCNAIKERESGSLDSLNFIDMRINLDSAQQLANFLREYPLLKNLEMKRTQMDNTTVQALCQGFTENLKLVSLDVSRNFFEDIGFQAIVNSMVKVETLQYIDFEEFSMSESNLKMLISYLKNSGSNLTHLGISGTDMTNEQFKLLTDQISVMPRLTFFKFRYNEIEMQMSMTLNKFMNRHTTLRSLDVSHCQISDQSLKFLCQAVKTSESIESLNVSYVSISRDNIQFLCQMLVRNHSLISLLLESCSIESDNIEQIVVSLRSHPKLQILDISRNAIGEEGFGYMLEMCSKNHPIKQLRAVENHIGDDGDNDSSCVHLNDKLLENFNIHSLDLEDNNICNSSAKKLLALVKQTYFCEELKLKGNKRMNYETVESIEDECRKNHLIKKYIASSIKNLDEDSVIHNQYIHKKVKKIKIENKDFYQSDFIGKFVYLNKNSLQTLHFNKIYFKNGLQELLDKFVNQKLALKTIIFESCKLGPTSVSDLTSALTSTISLEELHLIDMNLGKGIMIKDPNHKTKDNLKVLNLKNNNITDFREIHQIIQQSRSLKKIDLRGNPISSKGQFDCIIRGISRNISCSKIYFDLASGHNVDADRINAFYEEVKKNEYICKLIEWKQFNQYYLNNTPDLNISGTKNLSKNIDAVIKLYRCLANKTELILSNCKLEDDIIKDITLYLLMDYRNILNKLDLSLNQMEDNSCQTIARLFLAPYIELANLNVSNNPGITGDGMLSIIQALKKDKFVKSLNFENCSIDLTTPEQRQGVIMALKENYSLLSLNLEGNPIQFDTEIMQDINVELDLNNQIQSNIQGKQSDHKCQEHTRKDRKKLMIKFQKNYINEIMMPDKNPEMSKRKTMVAMQSFKIRSRKTFDMIDPEDEFKQNTLNYEQSSSDNQISSDDMCSQGSKSAGVTSDKDKNKGGGAANAFAQLLQSAEKKDNREKVDIDLSGKHLKDLKFLEKYLRNSMCGDKLFNTLNLSDNKIGKNIDDFCDLVSQPFFNFKELNISNNYITPKQLTDICHSLLKCEELAHLDIRDNNFKDTDLKIMYPFLQKNKALRRIDYTLTDPINIDKRELFISQKDLPTHQVRSSLSDKYSHHKTGWQEKICLPLWCWNSFIHDKHEAFRFKYDTKKLSVLEQYMIEQKSIKTLYTNSMVYYIIMFVCPFVFANECWVGGIQYYSHVIYAMYSLITIIFEIRFVLNIQRQLKDVTLLEFNKWHVVELIFGQIARFDTYLDTCFLSMISMCAVTNPDEYAAGKAAKYAAYGDGDLGTTGHRLLASAGYVPGQEPMLPYVAFFGGIFLTFPFYSMWRLRGSQEDEFKHTLPTLERCSKLAFIRENMLLATVLDSFCISNNMEIGGKLTMTTGRAMAFWTAFTQDFPQYIIHILFVAYVFNSGVSHDDNTVIMSLAVSSCAVCISAFNIVMCGPNEFDPMIVELELKKRIEADHMLSNTKKWMMERFKTAFVRPKSQSAIISESPMQNQAQVLNTVNQKQALEVVMPENQVNFISKEKIGISAIKGEAASRKEFDGFVQQEEPSDDDDAELNSDSVLISRNQKQSKVTFHDSPNDSDNRLNQINDVINDTQMKGTKMLRLPKNQQAVHNRVFNSGDGLLMNNNTVPQEYYDTNAPLNDHNYIENSKSLDIENLQFDTNDQVMEKNNGVVYQ